MHPCAQWQYCIFQQFLTENKLDNTVSFALLTEARVIIYLCFLCTSLALLQYYTVSPVHYDQSVEPLQPQATPCVNFTQPGCRYCNFQFMTPVVFKMTINKRTMTKGVILALQLPLAKEMYDTESWRFGCFKV